MTKKIYLIRHAQSEANIAADLDNPTYYYDAPITKVGEKQALNAKERRYTQCLLYRSSSRNQVDSLLLARHYSNNRNCII